MLKNCQVIISVIKQFQSPGCPLKYSFLCLCRIGAVSAGGTHLGKKKKKRTVKLWKWDVEKNDQFWNSSFKQKIIFLKRCLIKSVSSKQMFYLKVCPWIDSNRGSLVLEATALPTELSNHCPVLCHSPFRYFLPDYLSLRVCSCFWQ